MSSTPIAKLASTLTAVAIAGITGGPAGLLGAGVKGVVDLYAEHLASAAASKKQWLAITTNIATWAESEHVAEVPAGLQMATDAIRDYGANKKDWAKLENSPGAVSAFVIGQAAELTRNPNDPATAVAIEAIHLVYDQIYQQ